MKHKSFPTHCGSRRGLTLIELLVTITIIALLIGLLLPAVQSARQSALRMQCTNNLKQMGLGMHSYTSLTDAFPPGGSGRTGYSAHVMILPYVEHMNLYNAINFSHPSAIEYLSNMTVTLTPFLYCCPSDPLTGPGATLPTVWPGMTNYAGCIGDDRNPSNSNGIFQSGQSTGLQEVTDGMSSTVAMSEFLIGRRDRPERLRTTYIPSDFTSGPGAGLDEFTDRCRSLRGEVPNLTTVKGLIWLLGQRDNTLYNHVLPVNSPSCVNTMNSQSVAGATTATSLHPSGANALFADGHVQFVSETIDVKVWRALGTRNGGEIITSAKY